MRTLFAIFTAVPMIAAPLAMAADKDPLPWANPWEVGLDFGHLNQAYADLQASISEGAAPGVVALVMKDGHIAARRALGDRQTRAMRREPNPGGELNTYPASEPMTEDTLFDLASLTKVVACTTAVMQLAERGEIELDKPVSAYIPAFGARGKEGITPAQLLTHSSGLPAWAPLWDVCVNREEVYRYIDEEIEPIYPPGERRIYSDLGFITLGRLVETVSDRPLNHYVRENIFEPLGMKNTGYTPWLDARTKAAPTEYDPLRNRALKGIVHDENCRAMGGVSGHAGLFSTANDLAVFAQTLLNGGEFNGKRILKRETIETMLAPRLAESSRREGSDFLRMRTQLLGWWGMDAKATLNYMGGLPSVTAFSHTGFTGTAMCIDPEHNAAAILLSNAVHPNRESAQKSRLRRDFFYNVSKALVGEEKVNIAPED